MVKRDKRRKRLTNFAVCRVQAMTPKSFFRIIVQPIASSLTPVGWKWNSSVCQCDQKPRPESPRAETVCSPGGEWRQTKRLRQIMHIFLYSRDSTINSTIHAFLSFFFFFKPIQRRRGSNLLPHLDFKNWVLNENLGLNQTVTWDFITTWSPSCGDRVDSYGKIPRVTNHISDSPLHGNM